MFWYDGDDCLNLNMVDVRLTLVSVQYHLQNTPVHSTILSVSASDPDLGTAGIVSFEIYQVGHVMLGIS